MSESCATRPLPLRTPKKREALPDTLTMGELERLLAQPERPDLWERHHGFLGSLFGADVDAEVKREAGCDVILA